MGDELKPCPVCHKDGATDRYIRDGRQIFCPHCGWSAPSTFHGPNFEQRLADSWNTRTETQSQATIEELVGLAADFMDGCTNDECELCARGRALLSARKGEGNG